MYHFSRNWNEKAACVCRTMAFFICIFIHFFPPTVFFSVFIRTPLWLCQGFQNWGLWCLPLANCKCTSEWVRNSWKCVWIEKRDLCMCAPLILVHLLSSDPYPDCYFFHNYRVHPGGTGTSDLWSGTAVGPLAQLTVLRWINLMLDYIIWQMPILLWKCD